MTLSAITVITPCYNPGRFLEPCLKSVLAQGDVIRRHIVMDGGSTDGSTEVLNNYSKSYPKLVWKSEPDNGQSDALAKALKLVDTEYFGWLNADDCYEERGIEALVRGVAQARGRQPSIVYGDYKIIDAEGTVTKWRRQPSFDYHDCLYSYLTVQNAAAIFRTEDVLRSGGFNRDLRFCMDYDLILKVAKLGPVTHVRQYIGMFRHHDLAKTSNLQSICDAETIGLRNKYSGRSSQYMKWRGAFGKVRVAWRMLVEGCVPCRFGWMID